MPLPATVTISACLIVRDEAAMLADCLTSIAGADEVIVVDTGSTDDTMAIAARHGARVAQAAWTDDFAAARNVSLDLATGDWILVIDADQRLVGGIEAVRASIRDQGDAWTVFCPVIRNLTEDGEPASSYRAGQVFRRRDGRRYVGRIHERITDEGRPLTGVWVSDWHYDHLGFRPAIRQDRAKVARNLALLHQLVADEPGNADAWYYLGVEYQMAGRLTEALAAYETGLAASPGDFETKLLQVNVLAVLESLGDWRTVLERMVGWRPAGELFPDYWLIAGRAAMRAGNVADAREWFRTAAAFGPDRPVAYETGGARTWKPAAYLALIAAESGDWSQVRELLVPWRTVVGRDPFLTRLYLHAGMAGPDPAAMVRELADLLGGSLAVAVLDAIDEVVQRFPAVRAALAQDLPSLAGGRWLLARQCQRQGDWLALQQWSRTAGLPPAGAALLDAWGALGLGQVDTAGNRAAEACRLAPDWAEAWALRGEVAAAARLPAAWEHWQQALAAGAPPRPLWETMARHALATGDGARARTVLNALKQLDPMHPLLWPLGDLANRS